MVLDHLPSSAGIYCITNAISGRCYVGSALNLRKRLGEHVRRLAKGDHGNPRLLASWKRHGPEAFAVSVLESCKAEETVLLEREAAWIVQTGSAVRGYNICPVSGTRRGAKMSSESCARIGATKLGNTNRLGKSHGPETRQKIAASLLGKTASPESRANQSAVRKGKPQSADWVERRTAALRGRAVSEEQRERISATLTGRKMPAEVIAKRSATVMAKHLAGYKRPPMSEENKARLSARFKGSKMSDETRARMAAARTGRTVSQEQKDKIAAGMRAVWAARKART